MLGDISGVREIYIVTGYTDMRKSLDGLCAIIEEQFSMKVSSSALYLFCGKKCDRIKALLREPDGNHPVIFYNFKHFSTICIVSSMLLLSSLNNT